MKNKSFFLTIAIVIIAMSSVAQVKGTFTDTRDGKVYKTIKIGTQTWMAENLAYKTNNGCWAYDNNQSNVATYGYLYNWYSAKKVCPKGWHLPSDAEWTTLTNNLGGDDVAGEKMKSTSGWHGGVHGSGNGTNTSGFTALPGGSRYDSGAFDGIGYTGGWWSATETSATYAWNRIMYYFYFSYVRRLNYNKELGFSVRCVRDL